MITEPIQLRFNDIDMFGHVNNTVYFEYMDYGKSHYITDVLGDLFDPRNDALVIVNINCNFMHPTRFDESLEVQTAVDAIGQHSITFVQRVVNPATTEIKCEARVVMVGYNSRIADTIEIPYEWRKRISAHESRQF